MDKRYVTVALGVLMHVAMLSQVYSGTAEYTPGRPYLKLVGGGIRVNVDGLPSGSQNGTGPVGALAVGGGTICPNGLYLGGEVFAAWNKLSIESTLTTEEEVELHAVRKAKESFGGALQVGYAWNLDSLPSLIYLRMGVEKMNWARHAYATESSLDFYEEIKKDTVKPVFWVPGIGWRHHVTDHWAVNAEYQHALGVGVKKLTRDDKPKWSFQRLVLGAYHPSVV